MIFANLIILVTLTASALAVPLFDSKDIGPSLARRLPTIQSTFDPRSTTVAKSPLTAEPNGTEALYALVRRRLPERYHDSFTFQINETYKGSPASATNLTVSDAYLIATDTSVGGEGKGKISITSSTTSGLSRGLLTYLRSVGGDLYWSGDTFGFLPHDLPGVKDNGAVEGSTWAKWRYAFNVVTYSYTTAFYDWQDWEYLIDWCSLHGINFPLAIGGQEYVWREVYRDFGLNDTSIYSWFSGPAFQSWQRMGNIHGSWPRPVSPSWIDKQWALQVKIVNRMVSLGMTPVLPGFSGFVPEAMQEVLGVNLIKASQWEALPFQYTNNTALDPTWPSFSKVQSAFLQKQKALYGNWTSHYYSIDLFNELTPYSLDTGYLKNNTQSVVKSLRAVDAEATWVMQGWLFVSASYWNATTIEALLSGANNEDEMIVLDLASEAIPAWNSTNSYYGKKWIWNLLHDYGQNQGFYGALDHYSVSPLSALNQSSTMIGTGITMEGMNQNEVVYELTLDSPWSPTPINVTEWLASFIDRRYALTPSDIDDSAREDIQNAWRILAASAYNNTNPQVQAVIKSIFELVPSTTGIVNRTGHHPTKLTYDPNEIVKALDLFINAVDKDSGLLKAAGFQYDFVDAARQVLANLFIPIYNNLVGSWNTTATTGSHNQSLVDATGKELIGLLKDVDKVLATDKNFLVSNWIGQAKAWADSGNYEEAEFYEYEARNQITIWGPAEVSRLPWALNRYASKQWHGVVDEYYVPSWELFLSYLSSHNATTYNTTEWTSRLLQFELSWQNGTWGSQPGETWGTIGDARDVVKQVRGRWNETIARYYTN